MKAKSKQNIFDLTDQYFGDLNNIVAFAVDNGFTLNQAIPIDEDLVINNPVGTGNDKNKEAIVVQGLSFNNDQAIIETPTPPVLLTAVISNDAKANLVMTFDIALDEGSVPATTAFPVSDRTVSLVAINGPVVTLTVTVDFTFGQVVTVGYTKPVSNPLKSTVGLEVVSFANEAVTNNVEGSSLPQVITDNSPGWWIADDLSTITKDGADRMSEWRDVLGSGHDLLQAIGADMPIWDADGVITDGISQWMQTLTFTLNRPTMIYIVAKNVTWKNSAFIVDGFVIASGGVGTSGVSPQMRVLSGSFGAHNGNLPVNTFGIIRATFTTTSKDLQINETAKAVGGAATKDMSGVTIGALPGPSNFGNCQIKEIGVMPGDMGEQDIYDYLNTKYGPY